MQSVSEQDPVTVGLNQGQVPLAGWLAARRGTGLVLGRRAKSSPNQEQVKPPWVDQSSRVDGGQCDWRREREKVGGS